ncbi:MAG: hypothetical protein H6P94_358 [Thermoplasmatales archaeon]|nr:hypothetical protein [Thermoplasmatales archaeon]
MSKNSYQHSNKNEKKQKRRITICLHKNLIRDAQKLKIDISSFVEIELRKYIAVIDRRNDEASPKRDECGRRDLNPSFKLGKLK